MYQPEMIDVPKLPEGGSTFSQPGELAVNLGDYWQLKTHQPIHEVSQ
jgi:hypothetical protein